MVPLISGKEVFFFFFFFKQRKIERAMFQYKSIAVSGEKKNTKLTQDVVKFKQTPVNKNSGPFPDVMTDM